MQLFSCKNIYVYTIIIFYGIYGGSFEEINQLDKNFLLPSSLKPNHQLVRLQPFINGNQSINGYTEINVNITETTSNITLHSITIEVDTDSLKIFHPSTSENLRVLSTKYDVKSQFFIIFVEEKTLKAGENYVIYMNFLGYLNTDLIGFYKSYYNDENGNIVNFAVSQFASIYARYAFPCFDEPAMKAVFKIELIRQENMTSLSNMPISKIIPLGSGWFLDSFEETPVMSSYLVAFLISDFINVSSIVNNVTYSVWTRKAGMNQANYALTLGPEIVQFYEKYFNIPYVLPKVDTAAVPDFYFGAMENWGLIIYRETRVLYDPVLSSAYDKQSTCSILAHELSHQWFGNLVTFQWWNDVWLNEGFATYMQYSGCSDVENSFEMWTQFLTGDLQKALQLDSTETTHAISHNVTSNDQIYNVYDTIAYSKGASVIRMMNYFLTEKTFQNGLIKYLNKYSYSNANQDNLWTILTEQAIEDGTLQDNLTVKEIMDTWTLQEGYPVLNVQRFEDGSLNLTQNRFLLLANNESLKDANPKWWIPLTYVSQDKPSFNQTQVITWMKPTESFITLYGFPSREKWVIFNVQQNGFYRVNYDSKNWNALIRQFQQDNKQINTLNRVQILDDGYNLARAGLLSYNIILSINSYLDQEDDYVPMKTALNSLNYLYKMFRRTSGYNHFKNYLLDILIPLYDIVGFADDLLGPHMEQLKRSLIVDWTSKIEYKDTVNNCVSLYQMWMQDPYNTSLISPNLRSTVYCIGITEGTIKEWNFAYGQYLNTNIPNQKTSLIYGMGCSNHKWILERYMDMTFSTWGEIRKQEVNSVFESIAQNIVGRDLAWKYIRENSYAITDYMGSNQTIGDLTKIVSEDFNTKEKLLELQMFKKRLRKEMGLTMSTIDQSVEVVQTNINWMDKYYDIILKWLIDN